MRLKHAHNWPFLKRLPSNPMVATVTMHQRFCQSFKRLISRSSVLTGPEGVNYEGDSAEQAFLWILSLTLLTQGFCFRFCVCTHKIKCVSFNIFWSIPSYLLSSKQFHFFVKSISYCRTVILPNHIYMLNIKIVSLIIV